MSFTDPRGGLNQCSQGKSKNHAPHFDLDEGGLHINHILMCKTEGETNHDNT